MSIRCSESSFCDRKSQVVSKFSRNFSRNTTIEKTHFTNEKLDLDYHYYYSKIAFYWSHSIQISQCKVNSFVWETQIRNLEFEFFLRQSNCSSVIRTAKNGTPESHQKPRIWRKLSIDSAYLWESITILKVKRVFFFFSLMIWLTKFFLLCARINPYSAYHFR